MGRLRREPALFGAWLNFGGATGKKKKMAEGKHQLVGRLSIAIHAAKKCL